jgi:hypothetical protein
LFDRNINQTAIESIMDGVTRRTRTVDFFNGKGPVKTSLADLGYSNVGLDDNWQKCGAG